MVLSEGVEMRTLTTEATLKVKNLDEITEEIVKALRQQYEEQVTTAAWQGHKLALVQLPVTDANKPVKVGKLYVLFREIRDQQARKGGPRCPAFKKAVVNKPRCS